MPIGVDIAAVYIYKKALNSNKKFKKHFNNIDKKSIEIYN